MKIVGPNPNLSILPDAWAKESVKAATTEHITLSAPQTVDGISLVAGDRCLVKNQNVSSANGIYIVAAGMWTRSLDADTIMKIAGSTVKVDSGTQGGLLWKNKLKTTDTLGGIAMYWMQVIDKAYIDTPNVGGIGYGRTDGIAFTTAGAAGDVLGFSASGYPGWSSPGVAGQTLISTGADLPVWQTASGLVTHDWSIGGILTAVAGTKRVYNDTGRTLTFVAVRVHVVTAPTGATAIFDVTKNGTTIYTTQANRPTVADAGVTAVGGTPDLTWANGEYLTIDCDQIGSTIAGADATITVTAR